MDDWFCVNGGINWFSYASICTSRTMHYLHYCSTRWHYKELHDMRHDRQLFIEIIDETLRRLPPTIPKFTKLTSYEPVCNLRREQRKDANGLKARRSSPNRRFEDWVDVQTISFAKEDD